MWEWGSLKFFSSTTQPKNFTVNTSLYWVLSNTPAKSGVDWMSGCRDNRQADGGSSIYSFDVTASPGSPKGDVGAVSQSPSENNSLLHYVKDETAQVKYTYTSCNVNLVWIVFSTHLFVKDSFFNYVFICSVVVECTYFRSLKTFDKLLLCKNRLTDIRSQMACAFLSTLRNFKKKIKKYVGRV